MMPSGEFSGWLAERSALCAAFGNAQLGLGRIGTALRLACGPVIPAISTQLGCCSKALGPLPAHTQGFTGLRFARAAAAGGYSWSAMRRGWTAAASMGAS